MKRRRKRLMVIIPVATVCVAGAGTVGYFKVAHTKPAQKTAAETQSAEAKKGNLSKTIVGTGNLDLAEAEEQYAPSGLEISEVMAESGDEVKEGDVLAVVDESSILEAMEQVQSEISELDENIREYQDSDEENVIEASVSGRVKKINVSAGADVSDTMVSDGALMVLSLDGKMAVSLSRVSGVSAGDSVTVTLSSGTQVTGTVDSVSGKECMVTLTDNGTTYGDTVTVTDSSGSSYNKSSSGSSGSGKTVSQMSYTESGSDTTEKGVVQLITLSSTTTAGDDAGMIICSDTGESVSLSDADISSDVEGEEDSFNEDASETATTLQFTIVPEGTCTASSLVITAPVTGQTPVTSVSAEDGSYTGTVTWNPGDDSFLEKTVYQAVVSLTAGDGYAFQADSISGITLGTVSGISVSQDGKSISFQITFPETAAVAEDIKKEDSGIENPDTADNRSSTDNDTDGISDGTGSQQGNDSGQDDAGSVSSTENTPIVNGTNSSGEGKGTGENSAQSGKDQAGNNAASGNSVGTSVNNISGSSSDSSQAGESQETGSSATTSGTELSASEYSTDVALFTISPDDTMTLEVSVDELDINSVKIGQEAEITFDAIEEKEFTGEVTEIGNTASVNGGVAKYTVSVSLPKDEEMKQGMNASATITIENRENVITIPVNALQEKGEKVFVYTEKDEDGNLSGETEVMTGLSDGSTVEITEGLSEGDTVYYNKTGNTDSGNSSDSGMPGEMDGMNGGPGGNSDSGNGGGPGGNGGPGGGGNSGGGGTPPNM